MATVDTSFLNAFYPEESLEISNVIQEKDNILIQMKSVTVCCTCPKCGQTTNNYHGTYKIRTVVERDINHIKDNLCLAGRRTQNEKTLHADLILAGITQLIIVVLADKIV